ncbi:MAG: vitamin-B12 independent methionine synthase [Candidatus Bathyarchaeia archaeon]
MKSLPLFPVTVVGSWPRPVWLLDAVRKLRDAKITEDEFRELANSAVLLAVKYQEDAGIDLLTDGEQRRDNFYSFVVDKIDGMKLVTVADLMDHIKDRAKFEQILRGLDVPAFSIRNPVAVGKVAKKRPLVLDDYFFIRDHTTKPVKVTLPGPYILSRAAWVEPLSYLNYRLRDDLALEIIQILNEEIKALRDAGVQFIQLDEPTLTEVVHGQVSAETFMCAALLSRRDPEEELELATFMINETVRGISGVKLGLHICRGNWSRREDVLLKGGYEPLIPHLMEMNVDQLVLEFATPRAGDLSAFKEHPNKKELGLGVVNQRTEEIESPEKIVEKAKEATKYFDPDKIYLNPDCGFGTFSEVPMATSTVAFEKLQSIVKAANILRKEFGG